MNSSIFSSQQNDNKWLQIWRLNWQWRQEPQQGPFGETILKNFLWCILMYFIFPSDGGAPKHCGAWDNLPHPLYLPSLDWPVNCVHSFFALKEVIQLFTQQSCSSNVSCYCTCAGISSKLTLSWWSFVLLTQTCLKWRQLLRSSTTRHTSFLMLCFLHTYLE